MSVNQPNETHAEGAAGPRLAPDPGPLGQWLISTRKAHGVLFMVVNGLALAANVWTGPPWWGAWVLLVSGAPFLVHVLAVRSLTVSPAWVDERTERVRERSYERASIEDAMTRAGLPVRRRKRAPRRQN